MRQAKVHFEGAGVPEYPHNVITACGINGYRDPKDDGEFNDAFGNRYQFQSTKTGVSCGRCLRSRDFRLS